MNESFVERSWRRLSLIARIAVRTSSVFAAIGLGIAGCSDGLVGGQIVDLDGTGIVRGLVFIDANGNEQADPDDPTQANVTVRILQAAGGREVASGITEGGGDFFIPDVPVGTYRLELDDATLPEPYEVFVNKDPFVVAADSATLVTVRASFPRYSLGEVLNLESGVRLFTSGIALNPRDPDGDGAVHLHDGSDYLRATDVTDTRLTPGDSVRLRGRTAEEAGQPVLNDVEIFPIQVNVRDPVPIDVGTGVAARAGPTGGAGSLNAALVRIRDAEILDTATVDGHLVAAVDDGTGPVEIVLRDYLAFDTDAFAPEFARVVEATGLLAARQEGDDDVRWRLLPRFPRDVEVEEFPRLSIQQIRQLPENRGATGHGIVLNPVDRPVPGTIHIREQGIHIRVRNMTSIGVTPLPGDSIRVRGHTSREALIFPVFDANRVTIISSGGADPKAAPRTTLQAATASNGQLADGLVRIQDADVDDTETQNGALVATVDDGSGPVEVVIHDAVGFTGRFVVPGRNLTSVTGLLIPRRDPLDGSVSWRIAPRFPDEIQD